MKLEQIPGGVTAPEGFQASGVTAQIKSKSGKKDVAILYSMSPATAAGVFTTNQYAAAPVEWCRKINRRGHAQAIVVNSGNANACTGEEGAQNAAQMAKWTAKALGLKARDCFVCSTGVIGVHTAHILDGRQAHSILLEIFTDEGVGTKLVISK